MTEDSSYTLPAADGSVNQVLHTDGAGNLSWAADDGGNTAYDDIGDPDAAGSITFSDSTYTATYTSAQDGWGGVIIENTAADNASDTTLLSLKLRKTGEVR